ncbi:MAG TPA: 4-hydroxyphenylpyruvate dioxygenase [Candidatus Sulfotelmatobacter sp.]|nr:4-hydroxyphenylpyruvate dioxygenase [Candidatus Sulfotelmatobacter sp.]
MGPYPHNAPPATISDQNPAGTDGFEFVEFAHPEPQVLDDLFRRMGFTPVARHKTKAITLWRQGDVNFLANSEPGSQAIAFAAEHGPCASSMAWRVVDAQHALRHATAAGAEAAQLPASQKTIDAPAIVGIGGSLLYFVDRYRDGKTAYDAEFEWLGERNPNPAGAGLHYIDHLTHNVHRGRMDVWSDFYANLFGFRQIRYFDIEGKMTGLFSRAMTSPDGKIRIPINESADDRSQIEEYLRAYSGEGIQHVALGARDIYASVDALRAGGLSFMPAPPAIYYEKTESRLPGHGEPLERLRERGILIDGEGVANGGTTKVLLQIFSATVLGPIFFEFIQRKGDDGFGEGNFRALFESIEEDQIRRGVLPAPT